MNGKKNAFTSPQRITALAVSGMARSGNVRSGGPDLQRLVPVTDKRSKTLVFEAEWNRVNMPLYLWVQRLHFYLEVDLCESQRSLS
ncbi:MAG: hypothetical protein E7641_01085 [Ruminococcaceae bacterium]|nr:hypothetical protein [Oscillospiraceae bacterium]